MDRADEKEFGKILQEERPKEQILFRMMKALERIADVLEDEFYGEDETDGHGSAPS